MDAPSNYPRPEYPQKDTRTTPIYLYFGFLTFLVYMGGPNYGLIDIPTSYMLKNQLHLSAEMVAGFRTLTAIPVYFAFVFGLLRDRWNPFGMRDRGIFLIFGPVTAFTYVWLASGRVTYANLFLGVLLAMISFRFVAAAYQGLISLVSQEKLMSGRLAVLWNIVLSIPTLLAYALGGELADRDPRIVFYLCAVISGGFALYGFLRPKSVFSGTYEQPQARTTTFFKEIARLVNHRAVYPAVLIMFLWNFAPGFNTPMQFYMTNELHLSDSIYGYFNAIFAACFIPTFIIYGFLCKRVPLKGLLIWGTVIAVPQMVPLLFIHSSTAALILAVPIGLMGGVATAAYYDLAMRSCPPGLQGTLMMMVDGVYVLAARGGDLLGTKIYTAGGKAGFLLCVIATTTVYALILPLILLVPKALMATTDGEENPEIVAEVERETAA